MNLNLFDDMDGFIIRERENTLSETLSQPEKMQGSQISRFPKNTPLAMAYVPFQQWGEVYSDDDALCMGTLFPDLNFPFKGGCGDE